MTQTVFHTFFSGIITYGGKLQFPFTVSAFIMKIQSLRCKSTFKNRMKICRFWRIADHFRLCMPFKNSYLKIHVLNIINILILCIISNNYFSVQQIRYYRLKSTFFKTLVQFHCKDIKFALCQSIHENICYSLRILL